MQQVHQQISLSNGSYSLKYILNHLKVQKGCTQVEKFQHDELRILNFRNLVIII